MKDIDGIIVSSQFTVLQEFRGAIGNSSLNPNPMSTAPVIPAIQRRTPGRAMRSLNVPIEIA